MDKVTECLDALIEEMRESRAYQNYLWMEEELEKDPDLKSRVDDYRIRNYRLQQSENVDQMCIRDSLQTLLCYACTKVDSWEIQSVFALND